MPLSAWLSVADLTSVKRTTLEKAITILLGGGKSFISSSQNLENTLLLFKQSGIDGIELLIPFHTSDQNILDVQKIIQKFHLPVFSIHQSLNSHRNISLSEIERLCQIANIFSSKVVVLHSAALGKKIFDKQFINALKRMQNKYQINFGIENMPKSPFTLKKSFTWKGKEFAAAIKDTGLAITFDVTHLAQVGEDVTNFYLQNKGKIINIHLSNYKKHWLNNKLLLQNHTHLALKKGELPIDQFLALLKKTRYPGLITMEINSSIDELCESAKMIKSYLQL